MKKLILLLLISFPFLGKSQDTLKTNILDSVQVIGIKPLKTEPITLNSIKLDTISVNGQDPFFILNRNIPNVLTQSDAGLPVGYSYVRMRGLDQTRINFTLNGIPLNEMEDQGIYFSNMPDFLSNISSIEVQRGIGSSKYGTTSMAGSVNLETKSLLKKELSSDVGFGSFNTFRSNIGYTSGLLKDKFAFSSRLSYLTSDGFRYNSGTKGWTYFGQGGYFGKSDIVKVYGFTGQSNNGMAWLAPNDSIIKNDYRTNLNTPDEKDKFGQNFIALNWINYKLTKLKFNSSIYFNNINGSYTSYIAQDTLGLFSLKSYQTGGMTNVVYESNGYSFNSGLNYNYYQRSHTLAYNFAQNDLFYKNIGFKQDVIAYTKINKTLDNFNLFVDLQYRFVNFNYNKLQNWTWNFFNPKFGIRYKTEKFNTYFSIAKTSREVTRTDLLRGYDNVDLVGSNFTAFGDTFMVNSLPERCFDFELGTTFTHKNLTLSGNIYVMSFNNERIPTGQINYIGLLLKNPVNQSIRYGFEFDGTYKIKNLTFTTNLSLAKTRINSWLDESGNEFKNKEAFASPRFIMNNFINYKVKNILLGLNGQYVSGMYLDNRNLQNLRTPQYYILSAQIGLTYDKLLITLNANNLLNQKYYLPGGVYLNRPAYYVGALTNLFLNVKFTL